MGRRRIRVGSEDWITGDDIRRELDPARTGLFPARPAVPPAGWSAADGFQGACVCKADSDGSAGEWCDGGLDAKVNACRPMLAQGEKCGSAVSLGNDHKCRPPETGPRR